MDTDERRSERERAKRIHEITGGMIMNIDYDAPPMKIENAPVGDEDSIVGAIMLIVGYIGGLIMTVMVLRLLGTGR